MAKTDKFLEAYKRLNSAQKEAVDSIEGPVMVIAGPGTGKTQILTLRIANILLKTDTPANGILALTFTEAGQKAMRARLRDFVGSRADQVGIFTYHGFAASVIADYPEHFLHLSRSRQLSDVEAETMMREILREKKFTKLRPLGDPEFYVGKIIKTISDCRKEAWTPEFVREYARAEVKRVKNDPASISTRGATKGKFKAEAEKQIERAERTLIFAEVYERYQECKRAERRHDFDDLIFELISALEQDELLLRLIQERYLYLLVDEHQDTNDSQNLLIKKIADFYDEPNLFVVGDEKQAIYRFQGASVQNFLRFQDIWPKMKVISLVNNYRSHQSILDASFKMIENNYSQGEHKNLRIRLEAAGPEAPEPVELVMAGNNVAAEKYLAYEIKRITESQSAATVAVIVRTNREAERVLEVLGSSGIRAAAERGADIFAHPIGVLFFKLLEFLADESQAEALAYTLSGGLWGLNLTESANLIKRLRGGLAGVEQEIPALLRLKSLIAKSGTIEFLILAAEVSGLTKLVSTEPLATEVWRSIVVMAEDLARTKRIEDPRLLIKELLDYRQMAETRSIKISAGITDAKVLVMTAHSSKGLEFDYVFLPYATEESWMPKGRGQSFVLPMSKDDDDEVRDARRLFYVALTRARRHAAIIVSLSSAPDRPLSPLRFIGELDQEHLSRVEIPEEQTASSLVAMISPEDKDKLESLEYAKHRLLEGGLSVTALNHFCDCPSKFFYKSILKLPEPPSPPSEKGNAMHEALAAVWILPEKNEEAIVAEIIKVIESYFDRSFLPIYEKEAIVEELCAAAPKVAAALKDHFAQDGKVSAEKWEEAEFAGKFGEEILNLRLHGKLDAIMETSERVLVYDYKTREALSRSAIKGETKSSDGNYFRQLIFYKLLLADNYRYAGKQIEPSLVFVKPDAKGRCPIVSVPIEAADLERVKKEIQALIDSVWSGRILTDTCDDPKCEFCKLKMLKRKII